VGSIVDFIEERWDEESTAQSTTGLQGLSRFPYIELDLKSKKFRRLPGIRKEPIAP
jgi:hypothetical protein